MSKVWKPVPDGSLALVLKGLERYQRQIGRAALQGWYDTDVARNEIARIDEMLQALRGNEDAPPTLALCRRKEQTKASYPSGGQIITTQ